MESLAGTATKLICDVSEDRVDLATEQSKCSDRNNCHQGDNQGVFSKPLPSFIS